MREKNMQCKSNCIKCKSKRTLENVEKFLKCNNCGTEFYVSTRKKRAYPDKENKDILKRADKYRLEQIYEKMNKVVHQSERENIRDTMKGKLLKFRHSSARWNLNLIDDKIQISVLVKTENGSEEVNMLTNISVEEYNLIKISDPKFDKTVYINPYYPWNVYISFLRERKIIKNHSHIVEIGADINFNEHFAKIRIDKNIKTKTVKSKFPKEKIEKLLKKENKEQSKGNLPKKTMFHSISINETKSAYRRFIEKIHKESRNELGLKTYKSIKFIWYIENPTVLRKMHTQFMKQGWKPTMLKYCLEEKQNRIYIEIIERNPAFTSRICPNCLNIYSKEEKEKMKTLKCDCGFTGEWHEAASLNLLNGNYGIICYKCGKPNMININKLNCNNDDIIIGMDCLYCNEFIKIR